MEDQNENIITLLSFRMGGEIYAIPVAKVIEVMDHCKITKVPKTDDHLLGVINLRGEVLPVIDLRRRYGMPVKEETIHTKIVILDLIQDQKQHVTGILVDNVIEVLEVPENQLEEVPAIGNKYAPILSGMVQWKKDYILLLNLEQVFAEEEKV